MRRYAITAVILLSAAWLMPPANNNAGTGVGYYQLEQPVEPTPVQQTVEQAVETVEQVTQPLEAPAVVETPLEPVPMSTPTQTYRTETYSVQVPETYTETIQCPVTKTRMRTEERTRKVAKTVYEDQAYTVQIPETYTEMEDRTVTKTRYRTEQRVRQVAEPVCQPVVATVVQSAPVCTTQTTCTVCPQSYATATVGLVEDRSCLQKILRRRLERRLHNSTVEAVPSAACSGPVCAAVAAPVTSVAAAPVSYNLQPRIGLDTVLKPRLRVVNVPKVRPRVQATAAPAVFGQCLDCN